MPKSWTDNEMAGKDWLTLFKRRNRFSSRRPEPCSLARATAFNRNNVNNFYNNLEDLIKRNSAFANGTRIFNLDETSTTTVQKPQKVIAPLGRKCIEKVTSGERGTLVTTCCIVSASGNALPPVMIFPRKKFKDHMIKNTPAGTLGLATPSGWMNADSFTEVMKHFIKHTNSCKENPSMLVMDNHESHLSIEAIQLAKDCGVNLLTIHPHTSGKLQPLDVGVFSAFKVYYNAGIDSWLMTHPGKPVTIYDLGEIIGAAFLKAMTPTNITRAFAKCGIYPFDRNLFTDEDFLPSTVTDRPGPCSDCLPREEGLINVNINSMNVIELGAPEETTTAHSSEHSISQTCATSEKPCSPTLGTSTTQPSQIETTVVSINHQSISKEVETKNLSDEDSILTKTKVSNTVSVPSGLQSLKILAPEVLISAISSNKLPPKPYIITPDTRRCFDTIHFSIS
ncbi:unnamed protein product [Acanthoscelides obtectus]|uniref:DDE-1 domain-containing protein n=1 Tax=Acanthoscelides obtectus TaxID=200917 RepID=A0A9P0P9U7_ACAOB|nr:unnamed protein product [Acanthoscelides obtectus]CAK1648160.1 hypothetical protein AOBTE_LOCUS15573 [Acanthoscelides obtectus]